MRKYQTTLGPVGGVPAKAATLKRSREEGEKENNQDQNSWIATPNEPSSSSTLTYSGAVQSAQEKGKGKKKPPKKGRKVPRKEKQIREGNSKGKRALTKAKKGKEGKGLGGNLGEAKNFPTILNPKDIFPTG